MAIATPLSPRPLIVRCGAFGDMVLLTALIRPLHQRFGLPVDIVTSGPWSVPLLQGQPGVGEIYSIRSRKTPFWLSLDQQRVVRQLRARGLGPTWYCDGNNASLPILRRARISESFIVFAKDHDLKPGEHATEQWRRLAQIVPAAFAHSAPPLDITSVAPGCCIEVSPRQHDELSTWLAARSITANALIAIQIGNKRTMRRGFKRLAPNSKHWPYSRWAEVLRYLRARHPTHAMMLLGTGPERQLNDELIALANVSGVHNVADDLPIPRLMALLQRAVGLVSVDSGPAHAAAAVGCPQVVLFGKALPSLYRPWGLAGAEVKVLCGEVGGQPDMLGISSAAVTAAWAELALRPPPAAYPVSPTPLPAG
jgi:ADP-heptose:LPS heptosyltransferase